MKGSLKLEQASSVGGGGRCGGGGGVAGGTVVLTSTLLTESAICYPVSVQGPSGLGRRQQTAVALGDSAAAAAATDGSLVGLGYADTLPLRMCPGGMMSLIYASLILSVAGAQWTTSNVRSY